MSIIAQLYLSKALRSSEVGLYFVVKLGRETSLTNETLHTCLSKCVEDSNDLISVLGQLEICVLQYLYVLERIISKTELLRYRAWVDDAIAKALAP